jgi:NTE family protein
MSDHWLNEALAPVQFIASDPPDRVASEGLGLCLSGGGYRAMLFHLGALWRLNEFGYLPLLKRVSSVSGGSITAAVLGLKWDRLEFDEGGTGRSFEAEVVAPLRELAGHTLDAWDILKGLTLPGAVADYMAAAYRDHLFGDATLQDLPIEPRFVINATNVQSGALWRFMRPYMRDYRVGEVRNPGVPLAVAVAASAAFPPFLSPLRLRLDPASFSPPAGGAEDLHLEPFMRDVVLTDGGVYDNLGLETVWKKYRTVLVSDAGGQLDPQEHPGRDWATHTLRVLNLIDNQVRALRKQQAVGSFVAGTRSGAYWGIRADIRNYGLPDCLDCPVAQTLALADTPTRLARLEPALQERIINWGYGVCDAAMRKHVDSALPAPTGFPYPEKGVGTDFGKSRQDSTEL